MTSAPKPSFRYRAEATHAARGFSLVELMIAIALGLILMSGLAMLFANSSRVGQDLDSSSRQIENGRYAMELLSEDVAQAGYYGELTVAGANLNTPAPCATALANLGWNNASLTVPVAVSGLSATEAATLSSTCLTNYKANTPALVIHRVDTTVLTPAAAISGRVYLQTSRCDTDPNGTRFIVSSAPGDFTLRNFKCDALNTVQRYLTRVYYIASCNECGTDDVPTLKRAELTDGAMLISPLAEGIDDMGFDFGFDTDGDGVPDSYRANLSGTPGAADNTWANVVGLRINLLSRSNDPSNGYTDPRTYSLGLVGTRGPFSDGFKRRSYAITTRLNNVSGPRESP